MASDQARETAVTLPPLDPGVLQVIRSSADRLVPLRDTFVQQLRYDLATLMPDLVTRLPGEGWPFCERLVHTMLRVALYDRPPHVVTYALRQMGARNQQEGFPAEQYVSVAHALIRTVRDLNDDNWSTTTGSAWITYFLWIKPHLLAGADQAAAQPTGPEQAGSQQAAAQQAAAQQAAAQQGGAQQGGAWRMAARPETAQAQAQATAQAPPGQPALAGPDIDLESVANLLEDEDEDEDDVGYGQIMVSMTRGPRRERPRDD
jgi:hypothetical protein